MKFSMLYPILLACLVSLALALDQKDCRCRVPLNRRIINGGQSSRSWPWHLSLGRKISKENGPISEADKIKRHFCGAIILNEQWAITSADCMYDRRKRALLKPEEIDLGYNSEDLVEMVDQNKLVDVDQIALHPDFIKTDLFDNANLALLKLKTPFTFNDSVQPACLELDHHRKWFYQDTLVGLGFGVTELVYVASENRYHYGNNSRYLKESLLYDMWYRSILCHNENLDELVCLNSSEKSSQMCKGDNGSPLQKKANGKTTVIGLVSYFGDYMDYIPDLRCQVLRPCTNSVAYTHLAAPRFISWIEKMIKNEYCH